MKRIRAAVSDAPPPPTDGNANIPSSQNEILELLGSVGGGDGDEAVAMRYEEGDDDCEPTYFQDLGVCMELITELDALLALPAEEDEKKKAQEKPDPSSSSSHSQSPPASVPICRCEWNKVHLLPTVGVDADGAAAKVKKLSAVVDVYQQLPHLLHPHLESILPPLLHVLQRFLPSAVEIWNWEEAEKRKSEKDSQKKATAEKKNRVPCHVQKAEGEKVEDVHEEEEKENEEEEEEEEDPHHLILTSALGQNFSTFDVDAPKEAFHLIARALYTILKTAGEKACTSYFPNDVRHYEDVFYTLRWWARSPLRQREWEVRYCLLLWLSNLVLVPFSMHLFDTSMVSRARRRYSAFSTPSGSIVTVSPPASPSFSLEEGASLEEATLITAVAFLQDSTKCKDAAALLVARLLTRPDSKHQRDVFFRFTNDIVRCAPPTKRCPGYLWDGLQAMLASSSITCSFLVPFFHPQPCSPASHDRTSCGQPQESQRDIGAAPQLLSQGSPAAKKDEDNGKAVLLSQCFLPGVLLAVAKTMKVAAREEVVRYSSALVEFLAEDLWDPLHHQTERGAEEEEENSRLAAAHRQRGDSLLVKLCVKVVQRLLLSMLPNRRAAWKYARASPLMNLAANLSGGAPQAPPPEKSIGEEKDRAEENKEEEEEGKRRGVPLGISTPKKEEEEESDAMEDTMDETTLEYGIGILLEALGHSDTIVRWCAAKGVGRLCDRLPKPMAIDVLTAVLDLLRPEGEEEEEASAYNDRVWHGGILAIAELCRRGLLLHDTLAVAVPLIEKGLRYDVAKGTYSVGAHVRDAAAYTCWSMARAYDPEDLTAHVHGLSGALVATSLLDREVNVRRAASAAFQECVGRLGHFPHGISLCTKMDFFALSSLSNSYVHVTPKVAVYATYRHKILDVLVTEKLVHWDRHVRVVAAEALGRVAHSEVYGVNAEKEEAEEDDDDGNRSLLPDAVSGTLTKSTNRIFLEVFPELLQRVTDPMVATRHGAILGIAALVRHLPTEALTLFIDDIIRIIPRLDAARLFRSRGGEYVREGCCQLLEAIATHPLPIPDVISIPKMNGVVTHVKTLGKLQEFLEDSWASILDWMQETATSAFRCFAAVYYAPFRQAFHGKILHKLFAALSNDSIPLLQRRGTIAALGGVPIAFLLASPAHWARPSSAAVGTRPSPSLLPTSGAEKDDPEATQPKTPEEEPTKATRHSDGERSGGGGGGGGPPPRGGKDTNGDRRELAPPLYGIVIVALLCRLAVPLVDPIPSATPIRPAAIPEHHHHHHPPLPPLGTAEAPPPPPVWTARTISSEMTRKEEGEEEAETGEPLDALYGGWEALATMLATCAVTVTAARKETTTTEENGTSLASFARVQDVFANTSSDPECRRNAVIALCRVFKAIPKNGFSVPHVARTEENETEKEGGGSVKAGLSVKVEAVVAEKVVRTLLMALEDYATDHRGDIGSIVRLAVLEELPAVTLHAMALMSSPEGQPQQHRTAGHAPSLVVQVLQGVLRGFFGKLDRVREAAGKVLEGLLLGEEATTSLLLAACKEEERKEVRRLHTFLRRLAHAPPPPCASLPVLPASPSPGHEVAWGACRSLSGMTEMPHVATPTAMSLSEEVASTASRPLLSSTHKDGDDDDERKKKKEEEEEEKDKHQESQPQHTGVVKWRSPQWMTTLAPLLLCDTPQCFAEAVMEGLVTSAGDLTVYIRKPAVHALRVAFSGPHEKREEKEVEEEEDGGGGGDDDCHARSPCRTRRRNARELSALLVRVGVQHRHAERMVVPLSRVIDMLYTGHFLSPAVHVEVMDILRQEMKYFATAIRPLLVMTPLLGSLCRSPSQEARTQAWMLSLTMIASRYPRVRAAMASELYTALLSLVAVVSSTAQGNGCVSHAGTEEEEEEEEEWLHPSLSISEANCREAMEHLQHTTWDAPDATAIRGARQLLYPMLGLTPPPTVAGGRAKGTAPAPPKREMVASTYRSLVDEAGY